MRTFFAIAVLLAAGCSAQPVYNIENAPIMVGRQLTMNQVGSAIVRAGTRLGWQIEPQQPGRLSGSIALRGHTAFVHIEHDAKSYSIRYRDSTHLEARDGMIHRQYNNWVHNLDNRIRAELAAYDK